MTETRSEIKNGMIFTYNEVKPFDIERLSEINLTRVLMLSPCDEAIFFDGYYYYSKDLKQRFSPHSVETYLLDVHQKVEVVFDKPNACQLIDLRVVQYTHYLEMILTNVKDYDSFSSEDDRIEIISGWMDDEYSEEIKEMMVQAMAQAGSEQESNHLMEHYQNVLNSCMNLQGQSTNHAYKIDLDDVTPVAEGGTSKH